MRMPEICIIAAVDEVGGIGKDNMIPWGLIPEDMKRFRDLTIPYSVIMGRKTADSIIASNRGRLLPNRHNFVVTRDVDFKHPMANNAGSLEDAIHRALEFEDTRIAVIGGGQIYRQAIQFVDKLYLTIIDGTYDCDTFFPDYSDFIKTSEVAGQSRGIRYKFQELEL